MAWIAALGGALGSVGTGIAGAVTQNKANKIAAQTAKNAADRFTNLEDPDYEAMRLALQEFQLTGKMTPQLEQMIQQQESGMNHLQPVDPRLQQAEMDALSTLANISNNGGLDAQARLGMEQARMQNATEARGARQANLTNAAQRGVLGSGLEFVGNQVADQNAANRNYMMGLQQAAGANERDLQALQSMTGLSNTMQNRQFSQDSAKAQAQDAINRFNAQMSGDIQQRNIAANNSAQASNLANQQRIADANTTLRNTQQQYNKGISQQKFSNDLEKARGAAGLTSAQMGAQQAQGAATAAALGGIGQTLAGTGASIYASSNQKPSMQDQWFEEQIRKSKAEGK
jgi:hypothetical protein